MSGKLKIKLKPGETLKRWHKRAAKNDPVWKRDVAACHRKGWVDRWGNRV